MNALRRINHSKEKGGGSSDKRSSAIAAIRRSITSGQFQTNDRLPSRQQLSDQLGVGLEAVQHAVGQLVAEGFLISRRKVGTFVSERAPHVCRYAVAFPFALNADLSSSFVHALARVATNSGRPDDIRFRHFFGIDAHAASEDFFHLVADVKAHRMSGLIFASAPHVVAGTPLLDEPGIPRVAFMSAPTGNVKSLYPKGQVHFTERAVEYLRSRGRKRVAVLLHGHDADMRMAPLEEQIVGAIQRGGMQTQRHWLHATCLAGAERCVELLMNAPADQRPDALIVADDTLVEPATMGLVHAGVRAMRDVDVVAHCNYPHLPRTATPVQFLGYDVRVLLSMAVDSIEAQRRGDSAPDHQCVPALFEDEVREWDASAKRISV